MDRQRAVTILLGCSVSHVMLNARTPDEAQHLAGDALDALHALGVTPEEIHGPPTNDHTEMTE